MQSSKNLLGDFLDVIGEQLFFRWHIFACFGMTITVRPTFQSLAWEAKLFSSTLNISIIRR